jgi:ferredoxin
MPTVLVISGQSNEIKQEFAVEEGKVIFDELERQGHVLPHGCLSGSCGSCRIEIIDGAENLAPMGAVESDTVASIKNSYQNSGRGEAVVNKNIRLSCRAKVLGNIKIAVLK